MRIVQTPATTHGYRCVGCDRRADLVIDFGHGDDVIALCCDCAIGAASLLDKHARAIRATAQAQRSERVGP
jgi:hypothetical protein